jgi:methylamine dehydrogenase heavy chain
MTRWGLTTINIALLIGALYSSSSYAQFVADQPGITKLSTPESSWVWVGGAGSTITLVDVVSDRYLAQFNNGVSTMKLEIPAGGNEFYSVETYMSRMYRGERTDVVTVRDKYSLEILREIEIPAKSYEGMSLYHSTALSDDKRLLVNFNMTPGQSVSVVDLVRNVFVKEISTPGCALVYPTLDRRFHMFCGDGSMMTLQFDADGAEVARTRTDVFFDPNHDPLIEKGAAIDGSWMFTSFNAYIHTITIENGMTVVVPPWSLLSDRERARNWKPGGAVPIAMDSANRRMFVLMHKGGPDSHKQHGSHVWSYDLDTNARIRSIRLKNEAGSLKVTGGERPLLLATSDDGPRIDVYDAESGRYLHSISDFGVDYPTLLQTHLQ